MQVRGALNAAMRSTPPGGAEGGKSSVQGRDQTERDERTPACHRQTIRRRRPCPQWGWRGTPQDAHRALAPAPMRSGQCQARHPARHPGWWQRWLGGDRVGLVLRSLCEVRAEGFADAGPLVIATHVDQFQIGPDKWLKSAAAARGSMVPRQWQRNSQAPGRRPTDACAGPWSEG